MSSAAESIFGGDFEKAGDIGRSNESQYFVPLSPTQPGKYRVEIGECKHHKGFGDDSFIMETTLIESNVPGKEKGQTLSVVKKFTKTSRVYALRDVRRIIAAATGIPFDQTTETNYKAVVSSKQPLMGIVLDCEASDTVSPKSGKHFTDMKWSLVKGK